MNRKEFFKKLPKRFTKRNRTRVAQAYWLAKEIHRSQKRDGGERYFEHCRRVVCTLIKYKSKKTEGALSVSAEIISALLHDCVEDGFIPADFLTQLFGRHIAHAIDILSKVTPVFDENTGAVKEKIKKDPETYWQTIAKAPAWVRRVKLADRLDNISAMVVWPEKRQRKYIIETERYVLPIARATDPWFAEVIQKTCDKYKNLLSPDGKPSGF